MKVLREGHSYSLDIVYGNNEKGLVQLDFMQKENGQLIGSGTTNEEVLAMLIDRLEYLQRRLPCDENEGALVNLKMALDTLEYRTELRVEQGVEGTDLAHVHVYEDSVVEDVEVSNDEAGKEGEEVKDGEDTMEKAQ